MTTTTSAAEIEGALARWRKATTPLDPRAVDRDAAMIASPSRFLSARAASPRRRSTKASSPTAPPPQSLESAASPSASASCQAWSHGAFLGRVQTFTIATWFAKPPAISAPSCARHGWTNAARDLLECRCCGRVLCFAIDDALSPAGVAAVAERFAQQLETEHAAHCPWRGNPSPASFTVLPMRSPSQVYRVFTKRVEGLHRGLVASPSRQRAMAAWDCEPSVLRELLDLADITGDRLVELLAMRFGSIQAEGAPWLRNLAVLSVCGWTEPDQDDDSSAATTTATTDGDDGVDESNGAMVLSCGFCSRRLAIAGIGATTDGPSDHTEIKQEEEEEETTHQPPAKRPCRRVTLDPVAAHRSFCPWQVEQRRDPAEQQRIHDVVSLLATGPDSEDLWAFIRLAGWRQFAKALAHLEADAKSHQHVAPSSSPSPQPPAATRTATTVVIPRQQPTMTPVEALATVQSVLGLPDYQC